MNLKMSNRNSVEKREVDVAIIGGGPAGLSAAIELRQLGIRRIVVLERESEAGGIPRHCGHLPFGIREFKRLLTGPQYAKRLVAAAHKVGVELRTSTTVVEARFGGQLLLTSDSGIAEMEARRVIYATGVRETPRSARLITGTRPHGVVNTGALQSMVSLKGRRPFERPVIVGTELVSFSTIFTCRHAKIKPVGMIEESNRVTARWPAGLLPRIVGIPLYMDTRLIGIQGDKCVNAVEVEDAQGNSRIIDCDGVILTGRFTPETSLARCGHLEVDPATGGPVVDQFGRCSDPKYFATGNVLRPVETAGWSWNEGRQTARWVAEDLEGNLPTPTTVLQIFTTDPFIKYSMPQRIALPLMSYGMTRLQLRFSHNTKGNLVVLCGDDVVWKTHLNTHPERRVFVPIEQLVGNNKGNKIELIFVKL